MLSVQTSHKDRSAGVPRQPFNEHHHTKAALCRDKGAVEHSTTPGGHASPAGHAWPSTSERATLRQGLSCLCPAGTGQPLLRRTRPVDRNCCLHQRLSRYFSS